MTEETPDQLKQQADNLYRSSKFTEAISIYQKALTLTKTAPLYNNLSAAYYFNKDYENALKYAKLAIQNIPQISSNDLARSHERASKALLELKRFEEAETHAKSSLVNSDISKNAEIRSFIEQIKFKRQKFESKRNFDPKKAEELRLKGNELVSQKDFPSAIEIYTEALKHKKGDYKTLSNRALCYTKLMAWQQALEDCKNCIHSKERPKEYIKPFLRMGNIYCFLKLFHKALEAFEKAKEDSLAAKGKGDWEAEEGLRKVSSLVYDFNRRDEEKDEEAKERMERSKRDKDVESLLKDPEMMAILERMGRGDKDFAMEVMKNREVMKKLMYLNAAGVVKLGF